MGDDSIRDRIRYRRENAVDPEAFLRDAGAIRPVEGEQRLRLTDDFESQVTAQLEGVRDGGVEPTDVARIFGVEKSNVEAQDRPHPSFKIIHTVRNWPSAAALALDVATDAALRTATDDWAAVPPRQRYRMLQSLRSFQDACPFCTGDLAFSNQPVESCCSDRQVLSLFCTDCGRRYMEFTADEATMRGVVDGDASDA